MISSECANRVGPGRLGDVDRVADRRQLAIGARLAIARPGHVEELLLPLSGGVDPTLDDLNAVEIAADRILQRGDKKGRRFAGRSGTEIAAHRHAFAIANGRGVAHLRVLASKSQPPKKRTVMRGPVVA